MIQFYAFRLKSGVTMKLQMSVDEFHRRVNDGKLRLKNGERATLIGESNGTTTGCYGARWPCRIDALGVELEQIPEAMREDARIGVPTEYDASTGQPILTSPEHYRRYAEAHGYYKIGKKGGGYSDPQRLDARERSIRLNAGCAVRTCDDQDVV